MRVDRGFLRGLTSINGRSPDHELPVLRRFMSWLNESWHVRLPKPWAWIALAVFAVVCGAWVGSERERREKPAGLRTMALVALGSCAFTMVGYAFTSNTGDAGRVAAQIVTGIGFLGAGVLIRGPGGIQGATTAATIWIVAATGMAIGAGYVAGGIGLALLTRGVPCLVGRWGQSHFCAKNLSTIGVGFDPDPAKTEIKIEQFLADLALGHTLVCP